MGTNITDERKNICSYFSNVNLDSLVTESLRKCMKKFNNTLIEICKKEKVLCIDLFKYSKENWFYDDSHYNEQGSQEVAKLIYQNIGYPK